MRPGRVTPLGHEDSRVAGLAAGQDHAAVAEAGGLVREEHLPVRRLAMRVLVGLASLAKRLGRRDRLAEVRDDLLDRLRVQAREEALDFLLKIVRLARPLPALLADGRMSLDQPRPKPGGLLPDGGEDQPALARRRKPGELYRSISHGGIITSAAEKYNGLKPQKKRFIHCH